MKKNILTFLSLICLCSCNTSLPLPTESDTYRGKQFGVDKNINEETIDKYLNRDDVCYRDLRMLKDPANYEAIGGDSYLSGFIKGFEVVPFPYLATLYDLPTEVTNAYNGETLFSLKDGNYISNYLESFSILESFFPKDKKIFLMCGGGGYAKMAKDLLINLGWNKDNIYNVGGYWYYEGKNKIETKYYNDNNEVEYNFDLVLYHEINFDNLTKI